MPYPKFPAGDQGDRGHNRPVGSRPNEPWAEARRATQGASGERGANRGSRSVSLRPPNEATQVDIPNTRECESEHEWQVKVPWYHVGDRVQCVPVGASISPWAERFSTDVWHGAPCSYRTPEVHNVLLGTGLLEVGQTPNSLTGRLIGPTHYPPELHLQDSSHGIRPRLWRP